MARPRSSSCTPRPPSLMLTSNGANTATHPETFDSGSTSGFAVGGGATGFGVSSTTGGASRGAFSSLTALLTPPLICGQYETSAPAMATTTPSAATRGSHALITGASDGRDARGAGGS